MRTDALLLQDILESIDEVVGTLPASQDEFRANKLVQSHVLRHIQIIGEACWRLSDALKNRHPETPWKSIAGMRHVLVHDYFAVNWARVYETANRDVPSLRVQIAAMLASLPQTPES